MGEVIRFRVNANGAEVMIGKKWIPADGRVLANVHNELISRYPPQEGHEPISPI